MSDITLVVTSFLSNVWRLFSSVQIPAFGMTAAQLLIALVIIGFSLKLISVITGFNTNVGGSAEGISRTRDRLNSYRRIKAKRNGGR